MITYSSKIISLVVLATMILSLGISSAYICMYEEDNKEVLNFKQKINLLALKEDMNRGLTEEQVMLKLKYFGPCR